MKLHEIESNVYEKAMFNALEALALNCTEWKNRSDDTNHFAFYKISSNNKNCNIELSLILDKVSNSEEQSYEFIDEDGVMEISFRFNNKWTKEFINKHKDKNGRIDYDAVENDTDIENYGFFLDVKTGQAISNYYLESYDNSDLMTCLNLVMEMSK